jgi:hypothetical protein
MSMADDVARRFGLTDAERALLDLGPAAMDRRQRRLYHASVEPRLTEFRTHLAVELRRAGPDGAKRWATATAFAIMAKGYAGLCDQLVIDLVGRRAVSAVMDAARGAPMGERR